MAFFMQLNKAKPRVTGGQKVTDPNQMDGRAPWEKVLKIPGCLKKIRYFVFQ
jgi:hypothetical protein